MGVDMGLPVWIDSRLNQKQILEELDLSDQGLNDEDMLLLAEKIKQNNVKITFLNLYRNNLMDDAMDSLLMIEGYIEEVNLCSNNITDVGAIKLVGSKIKEINLADNGLSDISVDALIKADARVDIIFVNNQKITESKLAELQQVVDRRKKSATLSKFGLLKETPQPGHSPSVVQFSILDNIYTMSPDEAKNVLLDLASSILKQTNAREEKDVVLSLKRIIFGIHGVNKDDALEAAAPSSTVTTTNSISLVAARLLGNTKP